MVSLSIYHVINDNVSQERKMVSTTFKNINSDKKDKIIAALLAEFSEHSLADAKV